MPHNPPKLSESEIANFCRRLAQSTAIDADNLMIVAEDILSNEGGQERALMLLDGMRSGCQQAREAAIGGRVLAIWFDDHGAKAVFSWDGNEQAGDDLTTAIRNGVDSALRANGDTKEGQ